jgi:hypothetical protein
MQRRFPILLTAIGIAVIAAVIPAVASSMPYSVKALRLVSGPSPFSAGCPGAAFDSTMVAGQELETSITVNPANPRNLVASWIQDEGPKSSRTNLIASSLNGGKTWTRSTIPALTKCEGGTADGGSDPWVGAGVDGEIYFSGLAPHFVGDTPLSAIVASHSGNGGRTWHSPSP